MDKHIDIGALRCPDATIMMRKIVNDFMESDKNELVLYSIEPSLTRSLEHYIAHHQLPLDMATTSITISPEERKVWAEHFDEEDYDGVENKTRFHLTRTFSTNSIPAKIES